MSAITYATPFHTRTAAMSSAGAWTARGRFLLPAFFRDPCCEALAARTTAALFDFSFVERLRIHGYGATRLVSTAFASDMAGMETGESREVIWRASGGGVRGIGVLARTGDSNFLLRAFDADLSWFARGAPRFDATVRDSTGERGVLLLVGPYAFGVLAAGGLEYAARLPKGRHTIIDWSGVPITVSHWHGPEGFEISCATEHAPAVYDRLMSAGGLFGLVPAGQDALDILLLEAAILLPHSDYAPARDDKTAEPKLDAIFGIEVASAKPAPNAPLLRDGKIVGHTLRSVYSPALRRAIALAQLPVAHAAPGTRLAVRTIDASGIIETPARVVALPFL